MHALRTHRGVTGHLGAALCPWKQQTAVPGDGRDDTRCMRCLSFELWLSLSFLAGLESFTALLKARNSEVRQTLCVGRTPIDCEC